MAQIFVKGFLFDMDGTLVDSTAVVETIHKRFSNEYNLDLNEVIAFSHGRRTVETVAHFIGDNPAAVKKMDDAELVELEGITEIPGAKVFLSNLPMGSWAMVTSAGRQLAENRMTISGLDLPEIVISSECVTHGKPDPEGYLKGAQALGIDPKEILIFEDAAAGIKAALSSGAYLAVVGESEAAQGKESFRIRNYSDITVTRHKDGFLVDGNR